MIRPYGRASGEVERPEPHGRTTQRSEDGGPAFRSITLSSMPYQLRWPRTRRPKHSPIGNPQLLGYYVLTWYTSAISFPAPQLAGLTYYGKGTRLRRAR